MNAVPYLIDESALGQDAEIWFAVPPGFVPLPLQELSEAVHVPAQAGRQGDALELMLTGLPDGTARETLLAGLGPVFRMAQLLLAAGAVQCCVGLHKDDEGDGGLLLSLFTLASRTTDWAPRGLLAARAALSTKDAERIEVLDLSCGPVSLVQTRLIAPQEAGNTTGHRLLQNTAYVPCPDGRRLAILTLATPAVGHASYYRALLRDIVGTVSFDSPLPNASDAAPDED
ncbi:hypothetical protein [Streptomyces sp. NPDC006668]|uniref:hypothetical protein n=1 Tax=Streptomyces sp. NPDC006668 TaxID=3156903 RepID=UPI0033DBDA93